VQAGVSRNPFKKNLVASNEGSETKLVTTLSNDKTAILQRATQRQEINFTLVSLEVLNRTRTKTFERSFASIADKHPHHEFLTKQLLHGAQLDLGNRLVSFQTHQDCYYGIEEFIDFLNSSDQPHHKKISCLADLDFQTTRNFAAYFLQKFPGRTVNRKRYGRVKVVANMLKRKFDKDPSVGENMEWAQAPPDVRTPSESYPDEIFNQLIEASMSDIKSIMKMMNEYSEKLEAAKGALTNVNFKVTTKGMVSGATRDESNFLCSALTSCAHPDWPLFVPFTDASHLFSDEWRDEQNGKANDIDKRYIYRLITRMRVETTIRHHRSGEMRTIALEVGKLAYFCQFFFTIQTLFPFILYVQLNTGWNLEAVLSLTDDLESHLGEDIVDPDQYVLLYGTKWRTETVLYCRSNRVNPYSVYNILRFVHQQLIKFKDSGHYRTGSMWQGILSKNLWNKFGKIIVTVDGSTYGAESRNFLERHGICLNTEAKRPAIESRRVRTTWETKRREQGLPLETVSEMMGHNGVDVTSVHYDRDTGSTNLYHKKLRKLQTYWDDDFRNYGVRLSKSVTLEQLRAAIGTNSQENIIAKAAEEIGTGDEQAIIHLLSPEGQTYIAACIDSKSPTWPEADRFVPIGGKCSYFNRCCMCSQAVIFKEALPYIARRISDLTGLQTRINSIEWSRNYGEEASAWDQILNRWDPKSDVDDAKLRGASEEYALPLTMRGMQ